MVQGKDLLTNYIDDNFDQSIWRNNADAEMIDILDWTKENEKYSQLHSSLGKEE